MESPGVSTGSIKLFNRFDKKVQPDRAKMGGVPRLCLVDQLAGDVLRYEGEQERARFSDRQLRSKGWYNPRTGEVFINLGRHTRLYDILSTFLHETVAHKGLRRLFGKDFDTFIDNVYNNVNEGIRAEIDRMAEEQKRRASEEQRTRHDDEHWRRVATEEYMAKLAEAQPRPTRQTPSLPSRRDNTRVACLTCCRRLVPGRA